MPLPASCPSPRDPLPDPIDLLRIALDGLGQPLIALERLLDRMEGAR
jgi:hypothetical protein